VTVDPDLGLCRPLAGRLPSMLMQVEVLQQRHRYLVYQSADNIGPECAVRPDRPAHADQRAVRSGRHRRQVCSTDLQPPVMVAEAWTTCRSPGVSPMASPPQRGWCQRVTTDPSCGFELAAWTPVIVQRAAGIYGAQIMLTSAGRSSTGGPEASCLF
jgi:hypothetical protein